MSAGERKARAKEELTVGEILEIHAACRNIYDNLKEADELPFNISLALARNIRKTKKISQDYQDDIRALRDTYGKKDPDKGGLIHDDRGNVVFKSVKEFNNKVNEQKQRKVNVELQKIRSKDISDLNVHIDPNLLEPLLDTVLIE